ncbi:YciI family protein [Aquitalea pelogenes]|uniref:YciI family protein n=1 Tax=Aquitalea pelogenes TaxID=1293573 RepID=UPI000787A473|nr:YciI family protein [Aquitalea pelogenes]
MLFAITLHYLRPEQEVQAQLESHKTWLADNIRQGRILFAGPLLGGTGGFILAYAEQEAEIQQMIAADPFAIHQLAGFNTQVMTAAIRAESFPHMWAQQAKVI